VPTDEHTAAPHGAPGAAGGHVEQFGGDLGTWIRLLVPQGERTLQGIHAETVRSLCPSAHISRLHGKAVHPDVP